MLFNDEDRELWNDILETCERIEKMFGRMSSSPSYKSTEFVEAELTTDEVSETEFEDVTDLAASMALVDGDANGIKDVPSATKSAIGLTTLIIEFSPIIEKTIDVFVTESTDSKSEEMPFHYVDSVLGSKVQFFVDIGDLECQLMSNYVPDTVAIVNAQPQLQVQNSNVHKNTYSIVQCLDKWMSNVDVPIAWNLKITNRLGTSLLRHDINIGWEGSVYADCSCIHSSAVVNFSLELSDNEKTANGIQSFSTQSDPLMKAICTRDSHYEKDQVFKDVVVVHSLDVHRSVVDEIYTERSLLCYGNSHGRVNNNCDLTVVRILRAVTTYLIRIWEKNPPYTPYRHLYSSQRSSGERFEVGCLGCSVWVIRLINSSVQSRLREDVVGLLQVWGPKSASPTEIIMEVVVPTVAGLRVVGFCRDVHICTGLNIHDIEFANDIYSKWEDEIIQVSFHEQWLACSTAEISYKGPVPAVFPIIHTHIVLPASGNGGELSKIRVTNVFHCYHIVEKDEQIAVSFEKIPGTRVIILVERPPAEYDKKYTVNASSLHTIQPHQVLSQGSYINKPTWSVEVNTCILKIRENLNT